MRHRSIIQTIPVGDFDQKFLHRRRYCGYPIVRQDSQHVPDNNHHHPVLV